MTCARRVRTAAALMSAAGALAAVIAAGPAVLVAPRSAAAEDWPGWRGPRGDGVSTETDVPLTWSPTENVRWKVPLPQVGNGSPVVVGDRVLVTVPLDRDGRQRALLCLARADGKELWRRVVEFPEKELTHATNPQASATPASDGKIVVTSFGSAGVVCCDLADGKERWRRDLGVFKHIWGTGASPVLVGDLVILNCGPGERTFLLAMKKSDGTDVWKVDEPGGKSGEAGNKEWLGSWSTPRIVKVGAREELVMSWSEAVKAYDPKDGRLLWTCGGLGKLVYTSPVIGDDIVVAMAGYGGAAIAVRAGGSGDVTATHRLWHQPTRNPQRIGSGIVAGGHLYMANAGPGTLQCIELKTGKDLWGAKRGGAAYWGSMVAAAGRLYVTDQAGETIVLAADPEFKELARNKLGEATNATPAISNGEIFLRTARHLWCIATPKK